MLRKRIVTFYTYLCEITYQALQFYALFRNPRKLRISDWELLLFPQRRHKFLILLSVSNSSDSCNNCALFVNIQDCRANDQRRDWTLGSLNSQPKKLNFLTRPDLAFGFVHKRSGYEINNKAGMKSCCLFVSSEWISIKESKATRLSSTVAI